MGLDIYFIKEKRRHPEISEELAYFRKVNFLVNHFEIHGMDRNEPKFEITKEMCTELKDRCEIVLQKPDYADTVLETTPGFFFGSTDYDKRYYKNVEEVLDELKESILPAFEDLKDDERIIFYISW